MNALVELLTGILLGGIAMYWLLSLFSRKKGKEQTSEQAIVLLEKIKRVCKLITVEGEFAEIYTYQNTKERFLSLLSSKKKALIVIKAKAHIGYDLKQLKLTADAATKTITITHFPTPEILSIEPELEFYDIQNGLFNSFSPEDLTALNSDAKKHIREKIPQSGLMTTARSEVLEALLVMESIVATIGWKLSYPELTISQEERAAIEQ